MSYRLFAATLAACTCVAIQASAQETEPEPSEPTTVPAASEPATANPEPEEDVAAPVVESKPATTPQPTETAPARIEPELEPEVTPGLVVDPEIAELQANAPPNPFDVQAGAEYRLRTVFIEPIELSGEEIGGIHWSEMRGRVDLKGTLARVGAITFQADVLDGVLLGDNGSFVGTPKSNSGVSLSTKKPNLTTWEVGLRPGGDPLDPDDYGPALREADVVDVNHLYIDVFLPVGLLRLGRQPLNYGATITSHDGERRNRWGVSKYSDSVDRLLFGTKLDEAVKAIAGTGGEPDLTPDNGVLFALFYDFLKQEDVSLFNDDLRQIGTSVQWKAKQADWFGANWRDFTLSASFVNIHNDKFASNAYGMPLLFETHIENFRIELQYMYIRGETEEISEGFAALSNKEPDLQQIEGHGARAVFDGKFGPVTATLEFDYAAGDDDPRATTPITSYSFARDLNVGLLLFEHIIAFESARSVAVGIENLSGADVESFPLTEASTEGRFTNAIAAFPQIEIELLKIGDHRLHTRLGGLVAWSAEPGGVIDPILTSIGEDGEEITDDAVNYHDGRPARFYGTEIDAQVGYTIRDNFFWIVEGAYLFPGPALWDENQDAVNSFLVENRFVLAF